MPDLIRRLGSRFATAFKNPVWSSRVLSKVEFTQRAYEFCDRWGAPGSAASDEPVASLEHDDGRLAAVFDANRTGRGIWKWRHYFPIYERHFGKFVGKGVSILEIGIYSGGSLRMWRSYFGDDCSVFGVDIQPECRAYEEPGTRVFIGDQADREFWRRFKNEVPKLDVVIDDGGHLPNQQIVTLEELLPHLRPGGVYVCEDVHGLHNAFAAYTHGLADNMNHTALQREPGAEGKGLVSPASPFQSAIRSMCFYPFAVVIEKADEGTARFVAPRHGTEWQPFLDDKVFVGRK